MEVLIGKSMKVIYRAQFHHVQRVQNMFKGVHDCFWTNCQQAQTLFWPEVDHSIATIFQLSQRAAYISTECSITFKEGQTYCKNIQTESFAYAVPFLKINVSSLKSMWQHVVQVSATYTYFKRIHILFGKSSRILSGQRHIA